jgi:hypothetical protein
MRPRPYLYVFRERAAIAVLTLAGRPRLKKRKRPEFIRPFLKSNRDQFSNE